MRISETQIDIKIWELQKACSDCKATIPLADCVLFAVARHISTGRATSDFLRQFVNYPTENLGILVARAIRGNASTDAIIKKVKKIIAE